MQIVEHIEIRFFPKRQDNNKFVKEECNTNEHTNQNLKLRNPILGVEQKYKNEIIRGERNKPALIAFVTFLFIPHHTFFESNFIASTQLTDWALKAFEDGPSQIQKSDYFVNPHKNCNQL